MRSKYLLRALTLGYVGVLVVVPLGMVVARTFDHGMSAVWQRLNDPYVLHAF